MADHDKNQSDSDNSLNPLERLRESFREEAEDLAKLELDVEDLAERKIGLIKAYLKDDVHGAREFWEDLKAEAHFFENFVAQWLLQAANPSAVDWVKLDHYIDRDADVLIAGEKVGSAELACIGCGKLRLMEEAATLEPCSGCGCELYQVRERK